jgi:hypothetical protein
MARTKAELQRARYASILEGLRGQGYSEEDGYVWCRPMDIGATDASYHSHVLRRLFWDGLVEKKRRYAGISGGSNLYRITELGIAWLAKENA